MENATKLNAVEELIMKEKLISVEQYKELRLTYLLIPRTELVHQSDLLVEQITSLRIREEWRLAKELLTYFVQYYTS